MGENEGAPTLLPKVKMELDDATNFLELQMRDDLQESADGDDGSLDDLPPPVLQPEISLHDRELIQQDSAPLAEGGVQRSLWYQCKYCSVLLEDAMLFLFHIRMHEGSCESLENNHMDPVRLETQLTQAGVTIFSPAILTPRIQGQSDAEADSAVQLNLPPMPRLTRAPPVPNVTQFNPLPMDELPQTCKVCVPHLDFPRRKEFIDHLFSQHRIDNQFFCSKATCQFRTRSVQFLEKHMDEHVETQNKTRVYTCYLCKPKTKWLQSTRYALHMRDHLSEDEKYHCVNCRYSTPGLQLFNKHIRNKHAELTGGASFQRRSSLSSLLHCGIRRRPLDRQFLCYFCSKSWMSRKQYESHMILRHRNARGGYNCVDCNFVADSIRLIARHFKYKHGADSYKTDFEQADEGAIEGDEMEIDEYEEQDIKNVDMNPPILQFQGSGSSASKPNDVPKNPLCLPSTPVKSEIMCPLCVPEKFENEIPAESVNIQKIFDHIFSTHCRDNAIFCPHCSFRATSLETTLAHASTHREPPESGSKMNYLCRFCMSKWTEVLAYSQHMKQHLDENGNYVCPYCRLPYPTLNRFNEHVKRRHEMIGQPMKKLKLRPPTNHVNTPSVAPPTLPRPVSRRVISVVANSRRRRFGRRIRHGGGAKKSYACFYCDPDGLAFLSVKLYSRHMRELHMNADGSYGCPICPEFVPNTLKKINEHMKRKSHPARMKKAKIGRGPILANLLGKPQESAPESIKEMREEPKTEEREEAPKVEVKVEGHGGPVPMGKKWFQCKACCILVETKEKLIIHQRAHHLPPVQPFTTSSGIGGEKPQVIQAEVQIHDPVTPGHSNSALPRPRQATSIQIPLHKCRVCMPNKWFRTQEQVMEHTRENHGSNSERNMAANDVFEKNAVGIGNVDRNGVGTSGLERNGVPERHPVVKGGRKMTCLYCYVVFTKQIAYIKHMKEHTDENGFYHCPTCLVYSSPLLSRATKHIRRHVRPDKPPGPDAIKRKAKRVAKTGRSRVTTVDVGTAIDALKLF